MTPRRPRRPDPLAELPDVALLTADEVATALRISRKLVYRLIREGELPSVRAGSALRVPAAGLRAYVQRCWADGDGDGDGDDGAQPTPA